MSILQILQILHAILHFPYRLATTTTVTRILPLPALAVFAAASLRLVSYLASSFFQTQLDQESHVCLSPNCRSSFVLISSPGPLLSSAANACTSTYSAL